MKESESLIIAKQYIGKKVKFIADHPLGDRHHKYDFIYKANYGHIPDTKAPDGDELDAYFLGVDHPVHKAEGKAIAIVHRLNDDDDKLVIVADGVTLSDEEIAESVHFQEQFSEYKIIR